jgi:copper chaperone NosL
MNRIGPLAWLFGTVLLSGCQPADTSRPPTVRFGEEACAHCRMIISDERFAAARVAADGGALKFDDFGCLLEQEANDAPPAAAYWVHNFRGHEWLNARDAIFVATPNVVSPMGHGLAAVPTVQEARELAAGPASRMLRFGELRGFLAERTTGAASSKPRPQMP